MRVLDASSLDFTTAFSLCTWLREPTVALSMRIAAKEAVGQTTWLFRKDTASLKRYQFFLSASVADDFANFCTTTGDATISDATWYSACAVYDGSLSAGSRAKVYIGGTLQTCGMTGTIPTTLPNSTARLTLAGWDYGATDYWAGNIDETCVWNTALAQADVTQWDNSGKPRNSASMSSAASRVSCWRMGEGASGTTIPDVVGSNNGTLVNSEAGDIQAVVP